jgi:nitrogen fixation/metabolism regulation signal transduction histidine kinase
MILKKVYINFAIRLILLTANIFLLVLGLFWEIENFTLINLSVLLIIQLFLLIRKFNLLNKELLSFFESIKSNDSGLIFKKKTGDSKLDAIYGHFNEINRKINEVKVQSIKSNLHFQNLVEHVNTGIIQFDDEGNVEVINKLAKDFFQCGDIKNLRSLDQKIPEISRKILSLRLGSSKSIKIIINDTIAVLNFKITDFKVEGKCKKLVSFQNIKEELESNETDSWKKLIRVLTHEIMNSTAPISSSIKIIKSLLKRENSDQIKSLDEISHEDITNTVRGLGIIEERSEGLNQFVKSYRELTKNIEPYFSEFKIIEIFRSIEFLFAEDFKNAKIKFQIKVQTEDQSLNADKNLVEQVIINLVKNSIEATKNRIKREIRLESFELNNKICIKVTDTGEGISLEESDKIFIPFYTSKEEGSGIGLSISRQIMQLHNGLITFKSIQGTKTEFNLKF